MFRSALARRALLIAGLCAAAGAATSEAHATAATTPTARAARAPVATIKITGGFHAFYRVTNRRLCVRGTDGIYAGRGVVIRPKAGHPTPVLEILRHTRPPITDDAARQVAGSPNLLVIFNSSKTQWAAGHYYGPGTDIDATFGSAFLSANHALTKGTLKATMDWTGDAQASLAIHVVARWNC